MARARRTLLASRRDPLTGLPGRDRLLRTAQRQVESATPGRPLGLLFIDLDGFKRVNDTAGHDVGDDLLVQAATRIAAALGSGDVLARLSGDEFAVLLRGRRSSRAVHEAAESVLRHLADIPASVGVAVRTGPRPPDGTDGTGGTAGEAAAAWLREADLAMLGAKRRGGGRVVAFEPSMLERAQARAELYRRATSAVDAESLALGLQPVHDLATGAVVRVEALLRVRHADGSLHPPGALLDVAASTGRMPRVTRWVLEHALAEAARWHRAGHSVPVSVNLPAALVATPGVWRELAAALRDASLAPPALVVEVQRGPVDVDLAEVASTVAHLRRQGIGVLLEDVDTTWSLAEVVRVAPGEVSVGRFCLGTAAASAQVVSALVSVSGGLGCLVTAKNVETGDEVRVAAARGCHRVQGIALSAVGGVDDITWRTSHLRMRDSTPAVLTATGAAETVHACAPAFSYADRAFAENQRSRDPSSPSGPGGFSRPRAHFDAAEES